MAVTHWIVETLLKSHAGPVELAGTSCFKGLGEEADGRCCRLPARKELVPVAGAELQKLDLPHGPEERSSSLPETKSSAARNGCRRPLPAKFSVVPRG